MQRPEFLFFGFFVFSDLCYFIGAVHFIAVVFNRLDGCCWSLSLSHSLYNDSECYLHEEIYRW